MQICIVTIFSPLIAHVFRKENLVSSTTFMQKSQNQYHTQRKYKLDE